MRDEEFELFVRDNRTALLRFATALTDHRRRPWYRRERSTGDLPEQATAAPDSVDPQLMAALAGLPVRMRAAVVLRHVEGLSVEETARALGCSTGTVKSQTARGLDKLRDLLADGPSTADDLVGSPDHGQSPAHCQKGEVSWPIS